MAGESKNLSVLWSHIISFITEKDLKMERKLAQIFEYQKFQKNSRLADLIAETERRYSGAVSDEDLEWVNAAGDSSAVHILAENGERNHEE